MHILGIDPGTNIMGLGVIHWDGHNIKAVDYGILKLKSFKSFEKLKNILLGVADWIKKYNIDEVAIEAPFYDKNAQSMLKLGRAQGIAIASSINQGIQVYEYAPKKIKQSITGKGYSSKEQVSAMICQILQLKHAPQTLDASDALAVAICHCYQNKGLSSKKSSGRYKGWGDFIKQNPDKAG